MTIHNAKSLVGHILIIEKLVQEIKNKRPHMSDQQAFLLAHAMIETLESRNIPLPFSNAS
jgi:hypothetical protein